MNINITPLIVLIIIDIIGLHKLWNERFERRIFHHIGGYNYNKKPYIHILRPMLSNDIINKINNIKFPTIKNSLNTQNKYISKLFGGQYSKRSTLYFNHFNKETQNMLENIGNSLIPRLEKLCGKKLSLGNSNFRCIILRYEGKDSQFPWHYDTEPLDCYRTLCLIKSEGKIPNFMYLDKNHKKKKLNLKVGDGIFFKGTQTYHSVEKSTDENMIRYMIGFQFCSSDRYKHPRSLCSELRGKPLSYSIKLLLPRIIGLNLVVLMSYSLRKILVPSDLYYKFIIVIVFISINIQKYLSLKLKIGTGLSITPISFFNLFLIFTVLYGNYNIALGMIAYISITEATLPSSIIAKTLRQGGS